LAFRWDFRRSGLFFQTRPGSYNDVTLIGFLNELKYHFRGRRLILIWDGLPSHKSRNMTAYLATQRSWLTIERLPGYAPELNPTELVWGNVKGRELANLCADNLPGWGRPLPGQDSHLLDQRTFHGASGAVHVLTTDFTADSTS